MSRVPMDKIAVLADRERVEEAVRQAGSRRQALILLGITPGSRMYLRMDEVCERHGIALPGRPRPDKDAETKKCAGCEQVFPIESFAIRRRRTGLRQSRCRSCRSVLRHDHYVRNKERLSTENVARKRDVKLRNMVRIVAYLREHPCIECAEKDPMVLQFDHVHGNKAANVTALIHLANWRVIEDEIAKCVVRCANCHTRKTSTELGWLRAVVAQQVGHLPSKQA